VLVTGNSLGASIHGSIIPSALKRVWGDEKKKKEKKKRMEKLNYEWRFSVIKIKFIRKFICVIY
jgi:hypothetical protein